jgi:hypothetical protein
MKITNYVFFFTETTAVMVRGFRQRNRVWTGKIRRSTATFIWTLLHFGASISGANIKNIGFFTTMHDENSF